MFNREVLVAVCAIALFLLVPFQNLDAAEGDSIIVIFSGESGTGGSAGDFIQNQDTTDQDASLRISGDGLFGGSVGVGTTDPGSAKLKISGGDLDMDGNNIINEPDLDALKTPLSDEGLVLYLPLNENVGEIAKDASHYENHGAFKGTGEPAWSEGRLGTAVDFDGIDDYVNVLDDDALDVGTDGIFSISLWVKRGRTGADERFFTHWGGGPNGFLLGFNTSNELELGLGNGVAHYYTFTPTIDDLNWHHIGIVYNSSKAKLWLDGEYIEEKDVIATITASSHSLFVGCGYNSTDQNFKGIIDEARLYNRALSSAEIKKHYLNSPIANSSCDLSRIFQQVELYRSMGELVLDIGFGAPGGQITDASIYQQSLTNYGSTQSGKARNFDGTDDYIEIAASNSLNFTDVKTFSAWIYAHSDMTTGGPYYIWDDRPNNNLCVCIDDGYLKLLNCEGGCYGATGIGDWPTEEWFHLVAIYDTADPTTGAKIYLNGILEGSGSTRSMNTTSGRTYLGSNGGTWRFFRGMLDEVRIYNRALTSSEIKARYEMTKRYH